MKWWWSLYSFIYLYFCRDPNLWLVKCRIGEERATALQLMRKFIAYQFTDEVENMNNMPVKWLWFYILDYFHISVIFLIKATTNQSSDFKGELEGIHLHRGLQTDPCQTSYWWNWESPHGTVVSTGVSGLWSFAWRLFTHNSSKIVILQYKCKFLEPL